jgi:hypothetical protein
MTLSKLALLISTRTIVRSLTKQPEIGLRDMQTARHNVMAFIMRRNGVLQGSCEDIITG